MRRKTSWLRVTIADSKMPGWGEPEPWMPKKPSWVKMTHPRNETDITSRDTLAAVNALWQGFLTLPPGRP
jgi:hypothetical protein